MRLALPDKARDFITAHDVPVQVVSVQESQNLPESDVVVTAIAQSDDQTLFVRSNKPDRTWELPSGTVEPDESPRAALDREFREETGRDVIAAKPVMTLLWVFPESVITQIVFTVTYSDPQAPPTSEIGDVRWYTDLPDDISFGDPARDVFDALISHEATDSDPTISRRTRIEHAVPSHRTLTLSAGALAAGSALAYLLRRLRTAGRTPTDTASPTQSDAPDSH